MLKELMKEVKISIDNKKMEEYINDVVNTTKKLKDDELYVSEFPIYNNEKGVIVAILTDVYSEDIAIRLKMSNGLSLDFPVADFYDLGNPFKDIKDALDDIAKDMDGKLSKLIKPLLVLNNRSTTEEIEVIEQEDNDDNEISIGENIDKEPIPAESNNSVYSINLEKMSIGESITITKLNQNSISIIKNSPLNISEVKVMEDGNEIAVENYNKDNDTPSSSIINTVFKKLYEKMDKESIIGILMNIFDLGKTKLNKLLK